MSVSHLPTSTDLDVSQSCKKATSSLSPIDRYYSSQAGILRLGQPSQLDAHETLGRLLIMGLVTGVETYLRDILFDVGSTCPLVRARLADEQVALGALEFYGSQNIIKGLLEGVSLAGFSEVKKKTEQFTGTKVESNASLKQALTNFDRVCHLRHAAVHAQGAITRGNAKVLGVKNSGEPLQIFIDLDQLHDCAASCLNFVRDYNLHVFKNVIQRWLSEQVLTGDWKRDRDKFAKLYSTFYSQEDSVRSSTAYNAYRNLRPSILARLCAQG